MEQCGASDFAAGRRPEGFSLIEMMAVLVIASVLYFVALPGYQHLLIKSGRAAARGTLLDVLARQEQHFVNNKRYATDLHDLGLPLPFYIDAQAQAVETGRATYRIDLDIRDGSYVGAVAVPLNRQSLDRECMTFSLSHTGVRAVSGRALREPARCW